MSSELVAQSPSSKALTVPTLPPTEPVKPPKPKEKVFIYHKLIIFYLF